LFRLRKNDRGPQFIIHHFALLLPFFITRIKNKQMPKSSISIEIELDDNKIPQQINWTASDSTADMMQPAKSMMVAFWDGADKSALRIDLWTKEMMVDEMADFYYQNSDPALNNRLILRSLHRNEIPNSFFRIRSGSKHCVWIRFPQD